MLLLHHMGFHKKHKKQAQTVKWKGVNVGIVMSLSHQSAAVESRVREKREALFSFSELPVKTLCVAKMCIP